MEPGTHGDEARRVQPGGGGIIARSRPRYSGSSPNTWSRTCQSDPLLRLGVYSTDQQPALRAAMERLAALAMPLGLLHGDLSPRNLIVPVDGPPVLIDSGSAATGPVPHGELLPLLRAHRETGEPTIAELTLLADGLGAPLAENRTIIRDLMLLDAVDLVRWALDRRPDRLNDLARSARTLLQAQSAL